MLGFSKALSCHIPAKSLHARLSGATTAIPCRCLPDYPFEQWRTARCEKLLPITVVGVYGAVVLTNHLLKLFWGFARCTIIAC